jgi:hypothetical protein
MTPPQALVIVPGRGDGTFDRGPNWIRIETDVVGARSLALGDVDGDGDLDIAFASFRENVVTVLMNDGTGGFIEADGSPFPVGGGPRQVLLPDLNRDGCADIVTVNADGNDVSVRLSTGRWSFAAPVSVPVGSRPSGVASLDVDNDGNPDLATANAGSGDVSVLLGDGVGGFSEASGSPFSPRGSSAPREVVGGDVDGDGNGDLLLILNAFRDQVEIWRGDGRGAFTESAASPLGIDNQSVQSVALGDLDGDAKADLAVGYIVHQPNPFDRLPRVALFLGGDKGFARAAASPLQPPDAFGSPIDVHLHLGDLNRDGKVDVLAVDQAILANVFLNVTRPVVAASPRTARDLATRSGRRAGRRSQAARRRLRAD